MKHLATFGELGYSADKLQLFQNVDQARAAQLLAECSVARTGADEIILDSSSRGARLFIVLSGALAVSQTDLLGGLADGANARILPGECVGELSVLDEEAQSSTVYALQESELLVIEADKLWQLVDESNGVARNLLRLLSFRVRAANARLRRRQRVGEFYRQLSYVDGLTGLQNRAWLDEFLPNLIEGAATSSNPLSIVMVDIDHFKKFNDDYGHQAGDEVLRATARVLIEALRPRDVAVRYGGEELMVVLPNTHQQAATIVAQRLCEKLQRTIFFQDMHRPLPHITASFGVACAGFGHTAADLIATADAALYRAKHAGRNQVAV